MAYKYETQITNRIHIRSNALERSVQMLQGLNMFDSTDLTLFLMLIKTNRGLVCMKDSHFINVSSLLTYKSRYKHEIKQR